MIVDKVNIKLISGKGGDGMVHFRRISGKPHAGMDGGDGGDGGSIYFYTDHNLKDLSHLNSKKIYIAQNGQNGQTNNKTGKKGDDLIIKLPVGSIIFDSNGNKIVDLDKPGILYKILSGGRGGYGNAHFVTSKRQVIRFAELGEPSKSMDVTIELKMLADLAIVGLPNAGKSTFISVISNAKPKIADYPFTTLYPHPGVVKHKDYTFVACDIPGLIKDAHKGKGLGLDFLKHVERCSVVLHLISAENEDIFESYKIIENELKKYSLQVYKKPRIIAISKIDIIQDKTAFFENIKSKFKNKKIFFISSATHEGIQQLLDYIIFVVNKSKLNNNEIISDNNEVIKEKFMYLDVNKLKNIPVYKPFFNSNKAHVYEIKHVDNKWIVDGKRINQIAVMTDENNFEAMQRLYDVLNKIGVIKKIYAQNPSVNDVVIVADKIIPFDELIKFSKKIY